MTEEAILLNIALAAVVVLFFLTEKHLFRREDSMAGRTSDERGTPAYIIDYARQVMGSIDLDPASTAEANEVVQAKHYYTIENSGLDPDNQWFGNVWLNPPFSQPLCEQFIDRLIDEWEKDNVNQAIVLVNVSTGRWFHKLLERFPVVYPKHCDYHSNARIEFYPLKGNPRGTDNNSRGQAIFYLPNGNPAFEFGRSCKRFYCAFEGICTIPWGENV